MPSVMTKSSSSEGHVAVVTFPFTSHPLPLFNLVQKLAISAPQIHFSFFNLASSNQSLLSPQRTQLLPLNMKTYDLENKGAPHMAAKDPWKEAVCFIKSMPGNFKEGIDVAVEETGRKVTCLVTDAFFSFHVGKLAEEMGVRWVSFWVPAPYAISVYSQIDLVKRIYHSKVEEGGDDDIDKTMVDDLTLEAIPGLSVIRFRDMPVEVLQLEDQGIPDLDVFLSMVGKMGTALPKASAVVMNSYEELNPVSLTNDLKSKFQNFLYVGFLTLSVPLPRPPPSAADETGCLAWLDEQNPASVVYVSFGTMAPLLNEELVALAEALEASGLPFLWSLKDNLKEQLPNGFLGRTSLRGKVVPWAPQTQVLGHNSIGAHVTHCGYNSICESILTGVPMIGRSVWADNHMNARMVEEVWGIGVGVEGRVITKSGMTKCLEMMFQDEKGKKIREAISALKEVVLEAAKSGGIASNDFNTLLHIVSQAP